MPSDPDVIRSQVTGLLDRGLAAIDDQLQAEFDSGCAEPSRVTLLNGLRSRYVFDKMRVVRARIAADDGSPGQAAIRAALDAATGTLDRLQRHSARENDWIDQASDALDCVFTIYSKLAS